MDFDYQGRPDLSQQFTERMVAALGDRGMLRLMDFYKCYRAMCGARWKVFSKARLIEVAEPESGTRAERYFRLGHENIQTTHGYLEADLSSKPFRKRFLQAKPQRDLNLDNTLLTFHASL